MIDAHDKFTLALFCWAMCMLLDFFLHEIGVHPGPWRWRRALVTFGIGTFLITWLLWSDVR